MPLEFVHLRRLAGAGYSWVPLFDPAVIYEHPDWWDYPRHSSDAWFVQVLEDGLEVARVELDDSGGINPRYTDVPDLGDERLEVQLIEVATAARDRGVGTKVVLALAARHPERRLFAYSEGADRFWRSLGWERFTDPTTGPGRPLFIQPARKRG